MKKVFFFVIVFLIFLSCAADKKTSNENLSLDKALELYPDSIPLLQKRANRSLDSMNYSLLLTDAAHAFRLDSSNSESRLLYALGLLNKRDFLVSDFNIAQYNFGEVLKKDPKNLKALIGMANVLSYRGDFENSFKLINKALKINPRYRDAYVLKGSIYLNQRNYKLAKSSYETAVQQDNKFFLGYTMLGVIYQYEKDSLCIEYYTTALQLQPNNAEACYALAYAYEQFNKVEDAKRYYRMMAKLDTTFCESYFHLGAIQQFEYGNLDSAMHFYAIALDLDPNHIESLHNLGLLYEDKKDRSNALLTYAKVLKINPEYTLTKDRVKALRKLK